MSGKRPTEGCGVTCMGGGLVDGRDRDRGEGQDCEELRVEHLPGSPRRVVAEDSDEEDEGEDASDSALTAALSTMFCASGAYGRGGPSAAAVPVMTYDEVMEKMRVSPASRLSLARSFFLFLARGARPDRLLFERDDRRRPNDSLNSEIERIDTLQRSLARAARGWFDAPSTFFEKTPRTCAISPRDGRSSPDERRDPAETRSKVENVSPPSPPRSLVRELDRMAPDDPRFPLVKEHLARLDGRSRAIRSRLWRDLEGDAGPHAP